MEILIITIIVCCVGFFNNLRPSEAYLTAYLTGPWKNLTDDQVDNEIYPWWTYATLIWMVPVFLLADFLRYKPILVLSAGFYISTWALLLWAQGVPAMELMQVTFGFTSAGDVVYYSYLFSMVTDQHFARVSSFTRASVLVGKFVAYLCGQILVSTEAMDLYQLNVFSFVSVCLGFVLTLTLPSVQYSEIFHRNKDEPRDNGVDGASEPSSSTGTPKHTEHHSYSLNGSGIDRDAQPQASESDTNHLERSENIETDLTARTNNGQKDNIVGILRGGSRFALNELKHIYSSDIVKIWAVWWVFATCGNLQVGNYIQTLWKEISPHKEHRHLYNGAVEAAGTLFSSITVLLIGLVPIDWAVKGRAELLMSLVCGVNGVFLILIGRTTEIWVAYVLYDVFRASYQIVVTIATWQTAKYLPKQRYGFVFGVNMFFALLIETILTAIVVDKRGLGVDIRTQFTVYGGYFLVLTIPFTAMAVRNRFRSRTDRCTDMPMVRLTETEEAE